MNQDNGRSHKLTPRPRSCVICKARFSPKEPKQWTCSEKCEEEVQLQVSVNKQLEEEIGADVRSRGVGVFDEGSGPPTTSEADLARRHFGVKTEGSNRLDAMMKEAREERSRLGPLVAPRGESTWEEYLEAVAGLAQTARKMSGAGDAYTLVGLAQGYLGRVQEILERALEGFDVDSAREDTDGPETDGDVRPPDDVPPGPPGEGLGPFAA